MRDHDTHLPLKKLFSCNLIFCPRGLSSIELGWIASKTIKYKPIF